MNPSHIATHVRRGLGSLPGLGAHPGVPVLVLFSIFMACGALARLDNGLSSALVGLGVATIAFCALMALVLRGAYARPMQLERCRIQSNQRR